MPNPIGRRSVLQAAALSALAGRAVLAAEPGLKFGRPAPFSFARLKEIARKRIGEPYVGPPRPSPEIVGRIDYETWARSISSPIGRCSPTGRGASR